MNSMNSEADGPIEFTARGMPTHNNHLSIIIESPSQENIDREPSESNFSTLMTPQQISSWIDQ